MIFYCLSIYLLLLFYIYYVFIIHLFNFPWIIEFVTDPIGMKCTWSEVTKKPPPAALFHRPMEKAAKAEARLKGICQQLGITDEGRKWLDVALDPFKDIETTPQGYPDMTMGRSCVQVVHDTFNIVRPTSVPSTDNWDLNVFLDPAWRNKEVFLTGSTGPIFKQDVQSATPYNRGGLCVRSGPSGIALGLPSAQASSKSLVVDTFEDGTDCRVIGIGFEIHDTTQELKKQGSLTVYRVSDDIEEEIVSTSKNDATACNSASYAGIRLPEPPTTAQEAIDLPLSQQWEAKEGCYVTAVFNSSTNPANFLQNKPLVCTDSGSTYTEKINNTTLAYYFEDPSNATLPICLSGAFLQGLAPEASITVNMCYYIEQFPAYNSPLHRLTHKSCPDDFAAIELYTKIARLIPAGVPVNENFLGSFISGIANIARQVIPKILQHGPQILRGVQMASQVLGALSPEPGQENSATQLGQLRYNGNNNNREIMQPSERVPVRRNEVVVRQSESVQPVNNRQMVVYRDSTVVNTNTGRQRHVLQEKTVVKNKRNKQYNRTSKLAQSAMMPNKGNKWVDVKHEKK